MSLFRDLRLAGRSRERVKKVIPSLEALEDRSVPAVIGTPTPNEYGEWFINCNDADDVVRITDTGKSGANQVTVEVFNFDDDGREIGHNILHHPSSGVWRIKLNTGGGDDDVRYLLTGEMDAGGYRKCEVNLGFGADVFVGYVGTGTEFSPMSKSQHPGGVINASQHVTGTPIPRALAAGARLDLNVSSGGDYSLDKLWAVVSSNLAPGVNGDITEIGITFTGDQGVDEFRVDALNDVDVAQGAMIWMNLYGHNGNDIFDVDYQGEMDGQVLLRAYGHAGYDLLDARIWLDPGSAGPVDAQLYGNQDGDTFYHTLNVNVVDAASWEDNFTVV